MASASPADAAAPASPASSPSEAPTPTTANVPGAPTPVSNTPSSVGARGLSSCTKLVEMPSDGPSTPTAPSAPLELSATSLSSLQPAPPSSSRSARAKPIVSFDKTLENILKLDTHDLEIQQDTLVIIDKEKRRRSRRTCAVNVGTTAAFLRTIQLYNVLWAAVSADGTHLEIDVAEITSKTRVRATTIAVAIHPSLDRPTVDEVGRWAELLRARAYGPVPPCRRAYVLINPHAGPGGAVKLWGQQVQPLLVAARMQLTIVTTKHAGEAIDLCASLDLDAYDMIIPCSGDGLPHEVFNGLGRRPDARRALARIAVAHIPCGSGNAMACNLYGTHHASLAALAIIKGVVAPLDLVSVTVPGAEHRILSFLSQAVGIIAEIDLGTEHLRWMGGARFTIGFLQRLLARKVYPCDLAVKVAVDHKDAVRAHYARHQRGHLHRGFAHAHAHGTLDAQTLRERAKLGSSTTTSEADGLVDDATTAAAAASSGGEPALKLEAGADSDDLTLPPLAHGTVDDPLPDDWEIVPADKLGNFYCGNMAYMAPDANFFSAALMNDGLMDLVMSDGDISPAQSLGMLLSVEDGRFFDNPVVRYRKISAFRLTPKNQADGYISVDGERIPFGPFQAEVHQGLGRVIAKRTTGYEAPGPTNWESVTVAERVMG